MRGHNVCFHREIKTIIFELCTILPLICNSDDILIILCLKDKVDEVENTLKWELQIKGVLTIIFLISE